MSDTRAANPPALRRRLNLLLLVLYGVGITVGAGIYVLIGAVAGHAGVYAPWAFGVAAVAMAFTVGSYAELSTRFPVSAGEAAYIRAAFQSRAWSTATGLLTIAIGVVSSATVTLGSAGYIAQFVAVPQGAIVVIVVGLLAVVAAWGILESVVVASLFTLVESGGLLIIIAAAIYVDAPFGGALMHLPPLDTGTLSGIAAASLLAFFAFIGFEDLANVAEEAKDPQRNLPRAMILTLLISTALYFTVAAVAVSVVPVAELSASPAPLSLVFQRLAGISPATITAIAIVATLNTILAQLTMAARVVYGMARQGDLPRRLAAVDPRTGTPLLATALIAASVIGLAWTIPFIQLAEGTSIATLVVFALVNVALLRLKWRGIASTQPHTTVPAWCPAIGLLSCIAMIATSFLT